MKAFLTAGEIGMEALPSQRCPQHTGNMCTPQCGWWYSDHLEAGCFFPGR